MIDYSSLFTQDALTRKKNIVLMGKESAHKIPAVVLRSVLAPYAPASLKNAKKSSLVELWAQVITEYEMTVTATPALVSDSRDQITRSNIDRWLELDEDGFQFELMRSIEGLSVHTQKKELSNTRRLLTEIGTEKALTMAGLTLTWGRSITCQANALTKAKVVENLQELTPVSAIVLEEWTQKEKTTADWMTAFFLLGLCTGRRPIEILARGKFEFGESTFKFSGQAKTRGSHDADEVHEYPLLWLTGEEADRLMQLIAPHRLDPDCDERAVNRKYSMKMSRHPFKPPVPGYQAKTGRDLYTAIVISQEPESLTHPLARAAYLLGHKPGELPTSALSYQKYKIQ